VNFDLIKSNVLSSLHQLGLVYRHKFTLCRHHIQKEWCYLWSFKF